MRVAVGALVITVLLLFFVPRWAASSEWSRRHDYAVLAGALCASMAVSFVGFIGGATLDLWFKIVVDAAACLWLLWLGRGVVRRS
jgi:hypothetical protein